MPGSWSFDAPELAVLEQCRGVCTHFPMAQLPQRSPGGVRPVPHTAAAWTGTSGEHLPVDSLQVWEAQALKGTPSEMLWP